MSCNVAVLQPRIRRNGYGLGSSPFARHYWGNHCLFSVPAGTKMFQFPALASIIDGWYLFKVPGCPIRKSADRRSFAPPRGLSQLITSFIASESQGIRHAPLLTFLVTFTHTSQDACGMTYTSCFLAFSGNWFILLLVTSCHRALLWSVRNRTAYGAGRKAPLLLCIGKQTSLQYKVGNTTKIRSLQKGGVPAAPSGTATLLRLSPNYRFYPRALLAVTHFRYPRLSWLDGRCVQGPGTYSPRRG